MLPAWLATNLNASLIAPQLAVTAGHWQWAIGTRITFAGQTVTVTRFVDLRSRIALNPDLALVELSERVRVTPATLGECRWTDPVTILRYTRDASIAKVSTQVNIRILANDTQPPLAAGDSGAAVLNNRGELCGIAHSTNRGDPRNGISAINLMHADIRKEITQALATITPAPEQPTTKGRRQQPPMPLRPGVRP